MFAFALALVAAQSDYFNGTLITAYETDLTPSFGDPDFLLMNSTLQHWGFDKDNNRFLVGSAWHENELVSHYSFQVWNMSTGFSESNDTNSNDAENSNNRQVILNQLFLFRLRGVLVNERLPVLRFHWMDGDRYSDLAEIFFVELDNASTVQVINGTNGTTSVVIPPREFKSFGDLQTNNRIIIRSSGAWVNLPVVPLNSTLEDPLNLGSDSPVRPLSVFYRGQIIHTFALECSSPILTTMLNNMTRDSDVEEIYRVQLITLPLPVVKLLPFIFISQYELGVNE
jgi:hypothetical protein